MPLWIPIVFAASALQVLRSALQKNLASSLSTTGATLSRFIFAFPLGLVYAVTLSAVLNAWPSSVPAAFFAYVVVGAVFQVLATYALLASFHHGAFAIGTGYSKTEALQAVLIGAIVLGEFLSFVAIAAILLGISGVAVLAFRRLEDGLMAFNMRDRAVCWGLTSGAFFALTSVCFRGASLSMETLNPFVRAGWTLTAAVALQTVLLSVYLVWREPGELTRTIKAWRATGSVTLVSVLGSIGWQTAFSLQSAALVKAVSQVELVFATLTSWLYYKEPISIRELIGMSLIGLSVVLVVMVA